LQTSRLWKLWKLSDQADWHLRCARCDGEQVPEWRKHVRWEKNAAGEAMPETAAFVCEHCGARLGGPERGKASGRGRDGAQAEFRGLRGFRMSGLAVLGKRLSEMVEKWVSVQGNPDQLKVFINTVLAEWWNEEKLAEGVDHTGLLERREEMPARG